MAEILTDMESAETFKAYESYLLGQPAKAGTVLRQGAFLYIWKEKFETNGTVLQTSSPSWRIISKIKSGDSFSYSSSMTLSLQSWLS
jgi:hypothetical protein